MNFFSFGGKVPLIVVLLCLLHLPSNAQEGASFKYKDAKIVIENKQSEFKLEVKNNYFLDAGGFVPFGDFKKLYNGDYPISMNADFNFHKLRTCFQGKFDKRWGFKFEIDYAKSKLKYLCMELDYYFDDSNFLRMGNMKVPGTMSVNHSTAANMQMTTPIGLSLGSDRRMGLTYYHTAPRLYYALGLFTYNINALFQTRLYGAPELAIATRLGYSFIQRDNEKLFAALNGYFFRPQDGLITMDLVGGIESGLTGHRYVRNLIPETRNSYNVGAEMAYQNGRFLTYAEFLGTGVTTGRSKSNPFFMGWSATASYVLKGQPRAYKASMGDFSGSPYTAEGKGLEVGARVSGLSLNSGEFIGGRGVSYSAFASYWANSHLSFLAQISLMDNTSDALGGNIYHTTEPSFRGADFMSFQLRAAIAF